MLGAPARAACSAAVAAIEPLCQVIQGKIREFSAKNHLSAGDLSRRMPQDGANPELRKTMRGKARARRKRNKRSVSKPSEPMACSASCGVNRAAAPPHGRLRAGAFEPRSLPSDIVSIRRNRSGDGHDPVLTDNLVSTHCSARSTNFLGYRFRSMGLNRLDRVGHCISRVGCRTDCRSDDFSRSLSCLASVSDYARSASPFGA